MNFQRWDCHRLEVTLWAEVLWYLQTQTKNFTTFLQTWLGSWLCSFCSWLSSLARNWKVSSQWVQEKLRQAPERPVPVENKRWNNLSIFTPGAWPTSGSVSRSSYCIGSLSKWGLLASKSPGPCICKCTAREKTAFIPNCLAALLTKNK